jgi:hypothetical protein
LMPMRHDDGPIGPRIWQTLWNAVVSYLGSSGFGGETQMPCPWSDRTIVMAHGGDWQKRRCTLEKLRGRGRVFRFNCGTKRGSPAVAKILMRSYRKSGERIWSAKTRDHWSGGVDGVGAVDKGVLGFYDGLSEAASIPPSGNPRPSFCQPDHP